MITYDLERIKSDILKYGKKYVLGADSEYDAKTVCDILGYLGYEWATGGIFSSKKTRYHTTGDDGFIGYYAVEGCYTASKRIAMTNERLFMLADYKEKEVKFEF